MDKCWVIWKRTLLSPTKIHFFHMDKWRISRGNAILTDLTAFNIRSSPVQGLATFHSRRTSFFFEKKGCFLLVQLLKHFETLIYKTLDEDRICWCKTALLRQQFRSPS